jgi:hypothetical protein
LYAYKEHTLRIITIGILTKVNIVHILKIYEIAGVNGHVPRLSFVLGIGTILL